MKRVFFLILLLLYAVESFGANKTVTVKTSGGDYTSLNAALAGESTNLVTNTRILTIECYSMTDTVSAATGTGYTSNASYYIDIVAPEGERHSGIWDNTKYNLTVAASRCLYTQVNDIRIRYLQLKNNTYGGRPLSINQATGGGDIIVDSLITKGDEANSFSAIGNGIVRNCLVEYTFGGITIANGSGLNGFDYYFINNTVIYRGTDKSGDGATGFWGYQSLSNYNTYAYNNYSGGGMRDYYGNYAAKTNNASADNTGELTFVPFTTDNFINTTFGTEDLNLQSGSVLVNAGIDTGAYLDIAGKTRPSGSSFDIGAFEYDGSTPAGRHRLRRIIN